ncbi:hypothetical protein AAG570_008439 [Ranatra chinensis]|uniref:Uncharacterized protein n=1 Tax=Ranatra chinensis TaxID=642074 RepID=A0ABD0YQX1_9HEMI
MEQATTTLEASTADYTTMAQLAVNNITLIPIFYGNPGDLEEWLTAAAKAGAHLDAIDKRLRTAIQTSVYGVLLRILSPTVRADCGIGTTTTEDAAGRRRISGRFRSQSRSGLPPDRLVKEAVLSGHRSSDRDVKNPHMLLRHPPGRRVMMGHRKWGKAAGKPPVSVATLNSTEYDAIIGTDALRCVKGCVRMRRYDWVVRLGTMRYRSEDGVSRSGYVGDVVVKKMDHIRADNVAQHFEAVFHTEVSKGQLRVHPYAIRVEECSDNLSAQKDEFLEGSYDGVVQSLRLKTASKRRNMFHKNKTQETTENGACNLPPFCDFLLSLT